jgi:hypothetical protein
MTTAKSRGRAAAKITLGGNGGEAVLYTGAGNRDAGRFEVFLERYAG